MSEEKKPGEQNTHMKKYSELEAKIATTVEKLKELPAEDAEDRAEIISENVKGYKLFKREVKERCEVLQKVNVDERNRLLKENKDIKLVADDLVERLEEPIKPWIEENAKIVAADEERKRIKREAKQKRIDDIRCRLIAIEGFPVVSTGKNSNDLSLTIEELTAIDVEDGSFEEFQDDAIVGKQVALEKLSKMYEDAKEFEDKQVEAKAAQEKLDKEREEFEAERKKQQEIMDAQIKETEKKAEDDRKAREKTAKAEREKRQKVQDKEDADRAERRKQEDHDRAERKKKIDSEDNARAAQQKRFDEQDRIQKEKEQERVDAENKATKEKFEADEKVRLAAEAKAKMDADVKVNKDMRGEAWAGLLDYGLAECDAETIIEKLEQGKIPNIKVQWKVLKEKENA